MSIASGASSISVSLNGREVTLEEGLDEVVRDLQKYLNMVQCQLRTLGMGSERDDDFEDQITIADELQDNIMRMNWLFEDLYGMAYEIVGDAESAEEKAFLKQHKIARKEQIKRMKDEHAEKKRLEKEEMKMAKKMGKEDELRAMRD